MAVRDDFTAGEVLAAADLNDTFASKLDATTPVGKILQIVQTTTNSQTDTTSDTTFVSAGITATITPSAVTSKVLVLVSSPIRYTTSAGNVEFRIYRGDVATGVDTSSGTAQGHLITAGGNIRTTLSITHLDSPATTSAQTYTLAFRRGASGSGTASTSENSTMSSMILMEVGA